MPKNSDDVNMTMRLKVRELAELGAAAKILRARTRTGHVYNLILKTINEARGKVTPEEWERMVAVEEEHVTKRSAMKVAASQKSPNVHRGLPIKGTAAPKAAKRKAS